jgi:hypothetical protein
VFAADFTPASVILLVVSAAFAIVFAVYFVLRFAASFPDLPPPGPETSELGADPEPPAVANLLVNRCKVTSAAAAATLVDLCARGHLELQQLDADHFVVRVEPARDESLSPYEEEVLSLVREKATGGSAPLEAIELDETRAENWRKRFARSVVEDATARGLLRGRWTRADWVVFGALIAGVLLALAGALFLAHVEDTGGEGSDGFERENWFIVVPFAWLLALGALRRLRSIRYTAAGTAAAAHWLGVKRFLQRDEQFGETPPAGVAIWDRLLAYGAAVGAAHAAVAAIPLEEEDPDVAWSRAGGTWHQVQVEYPTRFGYGEKPSTVFWNGVLRTVLFGAFAFLILPIVVDALWSVGSDAIDDLGNTVVLVIVLVFLAVFGTMGAALVIGLADGVIRLVRGALDLRATTTVEGQVVKHHRTEKPPAFWFAVDPGDVDEVRALRSGDDGVTPPRGASVRVTITPHLRHVVSVSRSS